MSVATNYSLTTLFSGPSSRRFPPAAKTPSGPEIENNDELTVAVDGQLGDQEAENYGTLDWQTIDGTSVLEWKRNMIKR